VFVEADPSHALGDAVSHDDAAWFTVWTKSWHEAAVRGQIAGRRSVVYRGIENVVIDGAEAVPVSCNSIFAVAALACGFTAISACDARTNAQKTPHVTPVYNPDTGKLEQLVSDRDGDGRAETHAYMDGAVLKRIEIDRNGDGKVDRWEYYSGGKVSGPGTVVEAPVIERVDEANGPDARVTRREFFSLGAVEHVEEDTDLDGRTDKWEFYEDGQLVRVELDLIGNGAPSQRLVYGSDGAVIRLETDPVGDGHWVPVPIKD
jgi:hypothetical protein